MSDIIYVNIDLREIQNGTEQRSRETSSLENTMITQEDGKHQLLIFHEAISKTNHQYFTKYLMMTRKDDNNYN